MSDSYDKKGAVAAAAAAAAANACWTKQEKADEMFHTPRLALANNQSFFPTEMYIQQRLQEEIMNSNG